MTKCEQMAAFIRGKDRSIKGIKEVLSAYPELEVCGGKCTLVKNQEGVTIRNGVLMDTDCVGRVLKAEEERDFERHVTSEGGAANLFSIITFSSLRELEGLGECTVNEVHFRRADGATPGDIPGQVLTDSKVYEVLWESCGVTCLVDGHVAVPFTVDQDLGAYQCPGSLFDTLTL